MFKSFELNVGDRLKVADQLIARELLIESIGPSVEVGGTR